MNEQNIRLCIEKRGQCRFPEFIHLVGEHSFISLCSQNNEKIWLEIFTTIEVDDLKWSQAKLHDKSNRQVSTC